MTNLFSGDINEVEKRDTTKLKGTANKTSKYTKYTVWWENEGTKGE